MWAGLGWGEGLGFAELETLRLASKAAVRFKPALKEHSIIIRERLRGVHNRLKALRDREGIEDEPEGGSCLHGFFVRGSGVGRKGNVRLFCVGRLGRLGRGLVRGVCVGERGAKNI